MVKEGKRKKVADLISFANKHFNILTFADKKKSSNET